jgi:hypothetical protein
MKKDYLICFRTSEELRIAIEHYAASQRRSLSSSIETILYDYLKSQNMILEGKKERRRNPRKQVSIPAYISIPDTSKQNLQPGIIVDISAGGIRVSIPKGNDFEIVEDDSSLTFDLHFVLPNEKTPVNFKCNACTINGDEVETKISACFIDSDFRSYQKLNNYLN